MKLVTNLETKLGSTIERYLRFLEYVYEHQYKEVYRIWTLPSMSDAAWNRYFTVFDDTDFYEVKLLKEARRALKGAYVEFWKTKAGQTRSNHTSSDCQVTNNQGLVCDGDTR